MEILAKPVHASLERSLLPLQFRGPNLIAPPELQNPQHHQQRAEAGDNPDGAQGLFEFGGHRLIYDSDARRATYDAPCNRAI